MLHSNIGYFFFPNFITVNCTVSQHGNRNQCIERLHSSAIRTGVFVISTIEYGLYFYWCVCCLHCTHDGLVECASVIGLCRYIFLFCPSSFSSAFVCRWCRIVDGCQNVVAACQAQVSLRTLLCRRKHRWKVNCLFFDWTVPR